MNALLEIPVVGPSFDNATKAFSGDGREVYEVLEDLIAVLRDSEEGFRHASQHVSTAPLRNELMHYSGQRGRFVSELQDIERDFGREDVDVNGTVGGILHRAWMRFKSAVAKCDDKALLEEAAHGERVAVQAYEDVLTNHPGLPPDVRQCLSRQSAEIRRGCREIRCRFAGCPG